MPAGWSWTMVTEVMVGVLLAGLVIGLVARRG